MATDSDIFLVDLLALSGDPAALNAALGPALGSERVYKLGVGVSADIRKLGGSYPQVWLLVSLKLLSCAGGGEVSL